MPGAPAPRAILLRRGQRLDELRVSAGDRVAAGLAADAEEPAQVPMDDPVQRVHQAMWQPSHPGIEAG